MRLPQVGDIYNININSDRWEGYSSNRLRKIKENYLLKIIAIFSNTLVKTLVVKSVNGWAEVGTTRDRDVTSFVEEFTLFKEEEEEIIL